MVITGRRKVDAGDGETHAGGAGAEPLIPSEKLHRDRSPLVIATLLGGLGNQMFQYAAARALVIENGGQLQVDIGELAKAPSGSIPRTYELGGFRIKATCISVSHGSLSERARRVLGLSPRLLRETPLRFTDELAQAPRRVRLLGFWQSQKYFERHVQQIRDDFTFRKAPTGQNAAVAAEITSSESVSVHVRRGDYVSNPVVREFHGLLPLDYYQRAVEVIKRAMRPHFFVFCDEPAWCRANLDLGGPTTFIEHNSMEPVEDLRLMSMCRHHVIANSSFSWWGAWLDARPEKVVVAPQRWYAGSTVDVRDLIPEGWITL